MALRDYIHPGWWAPINAWRAWRLERAIEDLEAGFGVSDRQRRRLLDAGVIDEAQARSLWLYDRLPRDADDYAWHRRQIEDGKSYGLADLHQPGAVIAYTPVLEAPPTQSDSLAFLEEVERERIEKLKAPGEELIYDGPESEAKGGVCEEGRMFAAKGRTWLVTQVQRGSWTDHWHPGETRMIRLWGRRV